MKNRIGLLRVTFSVLIVAAAGVIIHELAHFGAARVLGIDIVSFTLLDPVYLSPAIRIAPDTAFSLRFPFWYAGGITAGLITLLPLVLKRRWFIRSLNRWAIGLALASLGFVHIGFGIMEGVWHQWYIEDAGRPGGMNTLVALGFGMFGFVLYMAVLPRKAVKRGNGTGRDACCTS